MKKNLALDLLHPFRKGATSQFLNTFLRIMKLSFISALVLLISSQLLVAATGKGQSLQNIQVKLDLHDESLKTVIKQIEKQTKLRFAYKASLPLNDKINIVTEKSVQELLDQLFAGKGIAYNQMANSIILYAQPEAALKQVAAIKISGTVTDETGKALPGATVQVKGTTIGTQTDINGKYNLTAPDNNPVLVFSFIGYDNQEVPTNGRTTIDLQMKPTNNSLNEVVVVGYGTQKRLNVTAAIASVPMKELADQPVFNVATALQGKVPGLTIKTNSGGPGSTPAIKIRGYGSISAGNSPLIVVDGNITTADIFQTLNSDEIESIDILKDASSAAIYGSKGSNGIMMVTTKRGKTGVPKIDATYYTGFQNVTKKMDVLNAQQFAEFSKEAANTAYLSSSASASVNDPNSARAGNLRYRYPRGEFPGINFDDAAAVAALPTVNYQDLVFKRAPISNYSLGVSGGTDKVKYLINGGYLQQDGIIITSGINRYTLRANVDVQATSKLKIGLNINPSYRVQHTVNADGHWADNGIVNAALTTVPFWPVYDANGNYSTDLNLAALYGWASPTNAVANATEKKRQIENINLLSNAYAEYSFLDNLKYRISGNATLQSTRTDAYNTSRLPLNGLLPPTAATGSVASDQTGSWLINQTLNYTKAFNGGHNIDALIGMEATKYQYRNSSESGNTFPNDVVQTLNAAGVPASVTSAIVENSSASYFMRLGYNYKSRYLVNFSIRRDGSSIFGPQNRYGVFPAGSLGWNISEEQFAKNLTWLSNAKVRVSYGLSGNNAFSSYYPYVSALGIGNYAFNNNLSTGVIPSTLGNVQLSWEKNQQLDLGLELGILKNRIALTVDVYNRETRDLLLAVAVPTLTGYGSSVQNIGKMRNRGLEIGLNTSNLTGPFTWNTNANISFNRNVVLALGPTGAPIYSDSGVGSTNVTVIGQPIGNFYGYKQIGIFQDQNDLNAYPHDATSKPGDVKYADVNGDGKLDANDRTIIGNNQPKFIYAFTNSFSYKGIDLSVAFQGVYGGQILNLSRRFFENLEGSQNQLTTALDRWRSPSQPGNGIIPRANETTTGNNNAVSSRWVESASYLRLQNVALGYVLPAKWAKKVSMSKARIYVSGQNIATWSKYLGYNSDVSNYEGALTAGVDYGSYPIAKTFVFGVNLTF